nr:MAG TPA: hypothetical protein [Caudoviricetes sp.]
MFNPYYIDTISGKVHTFPNDCALKAGLVRAWRRGGRVFDFRYRLKGNYTRGKEYSLKTVCQRASGITVVFSAETPLGREEYCF